MTRGVAGPLPAFSAGGTNPESTAIDHMRQPRIRPERPNTVAGLEAKRAELRRLRDQLESDLKAVTCDLDHLDAAIRLFDVESTPDAVRRYTTRHRAKKGTVRRFVLTALREAPGPITTKHLTERWLAERQLRTDDATWRIIRNRIGACVNNLQRSGICVGAGMVDGYKGWRIKP